MNKLKLGLGLAAIVLSFVAGLVLFTKPSVQNVFATTQSDNCNHTCPVVHFEWNTTVYDNCPSGYSVRFGHSNQCQKNSYPYTIISRPSHTVAHSADVAYTKSSDPNKCHRPSDEQLEDTYGMDHDTVDTFKDAHAETLDSIKSAPDGYYLGEDNACHLKTHVCTDETATNFDSNFNETTEVSDKSTCQYPEQQTDVCPNIEGNQSVIPDGYHFETVDDVRTCVQDPQNPEPTATPSATTGGNPPTFAGSSTEAPVCGDGNTVQLPANAHVVRSGSQATVNFFITEGDSANIYYRVVGQSDWQYSVADVKPNSDNFVSYTISGLDPQLGYDFGVQQKHGCGGGQLVTAVIVDGPVNVTFPFSYWEWSK